MCVGVESNVATVSTADQFSFCSLTVPRALSCASLTSAAAAASVFVRRPSCILLVAMCFKLNDRSTWTGKVFHIVSFTFEMEHKQTTTYDTIQVPVPLLLLLRCTVLTKSLLITFLNCSVRLQWLLSSSSSSSLSSFFFYFCRCSRKPDAAAFGFGEAIYAKFKWAKLQRSS